MPVYRCTISVVMEAKSEANCCQKLEEQWPGSSGVIHKIEEIPHPWDQQRRETDKKAVNH